MNDTPSNPLTGKQHFHLVLAEVIFQIGRQPVTSRRIQFPSAADQPTFPARRLAEIQNAAAFMVREELKQMPRFNPAEFQAHNVYLLSMLPLGEMTQAEFETRPAEPEAPTPAPKKRLKSVK